MKKIIVTGGGSGGHTMPALATINLLKNQNIEFLYIGSKNGIERDLAQKNGINFKPIRTGKLRRYFSIQNFFDIFNILIGIVQSFFIILKYKPDLIFSTGGFVSVPVVVAGRLLNKKILSHEQTVDAGLANKICSKFADKVLLTFSESKKYFDSKKIVVTGIPLREELFRGQKERFLQKYGFVNDFLDDRKFLYFSGGGLGCHILNITVKEILEKLCEKYNVIIQTGNINDGKDFEDLVKFVNEKKLEKNVRVFNFINEDLADVYELATLVISRSGAGTVNELIALKKPAIFIPLAIATNNEQYKNALVMKNKNVAEIIEEKDLTSKKLLEKIEYMINNINNIKNNFENFTNFVGNENIKKIILNYLDNNFE